MIDLEDRIASLERTVRDIGVGQELIVGSLHALGKVVAAGSVEADAIDELTDAAGVTIDTVLLKDDIVECSKYQLNDDNTTITEASSDMTFKDANAGTITANGLKIGSYLGAAQEGWQTPSLLNSWVNFGGTDETAQYFKDSFGVVHLKGMVKDGTGMDTVIFTLPAGYRPAAGERFPVVSNSLFGYARVLANGNVEAQVGSTAWFCLAGITFRIA